jgi:UDP-glucose 4-epimerase
VTGGAGFIGGHLVRRLVDDGHAVLVIDDLSTGAEANLPPGVDLERRDIATDDLAPLFAIWRPSQVLHLAAQASVPKSIADPLRDLAVNVVGTHRVAAAARATGAARFVNVSSGGAVYGERARPATEASRPEPASYYGVHKLAAEGHVQLAGVPFANVRPSNVYGPNQRAGLDGAVVASFLEGAERTGGLVIHGDGLQTRDFLHVRDLVDALVRLAAADSPSGTFNAASGRRVSIVELATQVERVIGRPLAMTHAPARIGDVRHSSLSAARLRRLGWRPRVSLREGIDELVALRRAAGA